jgi:Ca2+-transporting ATPase
MGIDSATIAGSALVAHFAGLARYGPGPQTRGMTFMALSLGQLFYTITCQSSDVRNLRPDRLFENRALDQAILGAGLLAVLPFLMPPLGRLLGVARLAPADATLALAAAAVPAAAVLARRGLTIELQTVEAVPCVTS